VVGRGERGLGGFIELETPVMTLREG